MDSWDQGCFSYIGKYDNPAYNKIMLQEGACSFMNVIQHEMMHAIGFYHEHNRPDRDNYITVVADNVMEGKENNFDVIPVDQWKDQGIVRHNS